MRVCRSEQVKALCLCRVRVERYMQAVYAVSALCLFIPVFYHLHVEEAETAGRIGRPTMLASIRGPDGGREAGWVVVA